MRGELSKKLPRRNVQIWRCGARPAPPNLSATPAIPGGTPRHRPKRRFTDARRVIVESDLEKCEGFNCFRGSTEKSQTREVRAAYMGVCAAHTPPYMPHGILLT